MSVAGADAQHAGAGARGAARLARASAADVGPAQGELWQRSSRRVGAHAAAPAALA
jgi:hypothetical protein